jgi:hypothetical protein
VRIVVHVERNEGWFARRRMQRWIRLAPPVDLPALTEGTVARVTGRVAVLDGETLEAPFTGRPCVYYAVTTVFVGDGRQVLASHENAVAFLLEAGDARAVIDLAHARVSVGIGHCSKSPATHHVGGRLQHGYIERREAVIAAGDALVVVGAGIGEPDPDRAPTELFRGTLPQRFRFTGSEDDPLLISDEVALFGPEDA